MALEIVCLESAWTICTHFLVQKISLVLFITVQINFNSE